MEHSLLYLKREAL
jgi:hypothetical protein